LFFLSRFEVANKLGTKRESEMRERKKTKEKSTKDMKDRVFSNRSNFAAFSTPLSRRVHTSFLFANLFLFFVFCSSPVPSHARTCLSLSLSTFSSLTTYTYAHIHIYNAYTNTHTCTHPHQLTHHTQLFTQSLVDVHKDIPFANPAKVSHREEQRVIHREREQAWRASKRKCAERNEPCA